MKLYRLALLIFSYSPAAFASWALPAGHTNSALGTTTGTFGNLTVTQGDPIIIIAGNNTATGSVTSISLNGGTCGVAPALLQHVTNGAGDLADIWTASNCSSSITQVAVNWGGGGTYAWTAYSPTGLALSAALAQDGATGTSSAASGSGTSHAGPSVTTTVTGDFLVSIWNPDHTVSAVDAAFTLDGNTTGRAHLTSNTAVAASYAPTWTISSTGGWAAITVAFKFSTSASSAFPYVASNEQPTKERPAVK